jgi:uncharacterized OsmC-like protein
LTLVDESFTSSNGFGVSEKINRPREVTVEADGEHLRTRVTNGSTSWHLSAEDSSGPDPVTSFLGALGSCLLMSIRVAARARNLTIGYTSVGARANEKGPVKQIQVILKVETPESDDLLHHPIEVAERDCHIRNLIRTDVMVDLKIERVS